MCKFSDNILFLQHCWNMQILNTPYYINTTMLHTTTVWKVLYIFQLSHKSTGSFREFLEFIIVLLFFNTRSQWLFDLHLRAKGDKKCWKVSKPYYDYHKTWIAVVISVKERTTQGKFTIHTSGSTEIFPLLVTHLSPICTWAASRVVASSSLHTASSVSFGLGKPGKYSNFGKL